MNGNGKNLRKRRTLFLSYRPTEFLRINVILTQRSTEIRLRINGNVRLEPGIIVVSPPQVRDFGWGGVTNFGWCSFITQLRITCGKNLIIIKAVSSDCLRFSDDLQTLRCILSIKPCSRKWKGNISFDFSTSQFQILWKAVSDHST